MNATKAMEAARLTLEEFAKDVRDEVARRLEYDGYEDAAGAVRAMESVEVGDERIRRAVGR